MCFREERFGRALAVPERSIGERRPVPKLGPFELDHKSAAWCLCLRFLSAPRRRVYPRVGFSRATRTMSSRMFLRRQMSA